MVEEYKLTAGTSTGQTVAYSIGNNSSANMHAQIVTTGCNKYVRIGNGGLSEGDTGVVIVNAKVSTSGTSMTATYKVTIDVTITADEIIDVDIPGD